MSREKSASGKPGFFRGWERDGLRAVAEQAIHYFNCERPVRKADSKPPALFRTGLAV